MQLVYSSHVSIVCKLIGLHLGFLPTCNAFKVCSLEVERPPPPAPCTSGDQWSCLLSLGVHAENFGSGNGNGKDFDGTQRYKCESSICWGVSAGSVYKTADDPRRSWELKVCRKSPN